MNAIQDRSETRLSVALAVESDREYCPECGRAWHDVSDRRFERPEKPIYWGLAMVAIGIYTIVFFGPRAWLAVRGDPFPGILPTATCMTAGTEQDYADCDATRVRAGAAAGLFWTVVGFGMIARFTVLKRSRTNSSMPREKVGLSSKSLLVRTGLVLWTFVETVGRSFFQIQLILFCYVGSSQLFEGLPLSWALIGRAIDRGTMVLATA